MVSELPGPRVAALLVLGRLPRQGSCQGYVGRPGKGVAGGNPSCPFALHASGLSAALAVLFFSSSAPPSMAAGVATTARAQVKGYRRPLLLNTDRSPRAWATHKRGALLGQAQNDARACVAKS